MRLMEFLGVNWTKSAENAENIKKGVLENHGHAAPFIAENETETAKTKDLDTNAYEYLLEQVNINKNKFSKTFGDISQGLKEIEDTLYEHWGKIDYGKGNNEKEINILPSVFHKFMEEGGFEDPKIILKKWKQKGLLNCEKDRKNLQYLSKKVVTRKRRRENPSKIPKMRSRKT